MDEVIDEQMDAICDDYEASRGAGNKPNIGEFLARVDGKSRARLFYWLLRLERQWTAEDPDSVKRIATNLVEEFPQYETVIRNVFPEANLKYSFPKIDGYQIESFIDKGGQGSVFKAIQDRTGQQVAIKLVEIPVFERGSNENKRSIELLRNEIRVLGALQHPNVVKIFDAGECEEGFFYVMQLVQGGSLADRIQTISQFDAADYINQIASAVAAANNLGILHLDIKPSNILFDENSNQPLLTDFGLSQFIVGNQDAKAMGGTPAYMAPEQLRGESVDSRTDVFGLGATLFALIRGVPDSSEFDREKGGLDTAAPGQNVKQANARLKEICERCTKQNPGQRYQTVEDLVVDLDRFSVREDARRVAEMGTRSILVSPFYIVVAGLISLAMYNSWEETVGLEIAIWLVVFGMYGGVFFTLNSATGNKQSPEETVALESLYILWVAKMMAALTIVIALRIFLSRTEIEGVHAARLTLLLSYPMFSALTGTVFASMAPRFWKKLYLGAVCWWLLSIVIIWVGTLEWAYLVPIIYGIASFLSSLLWGLQLKKFARENSAPQELMHVARTIEYQD